MAALFESIDAARWLAAALVLLSYAVFSIWCLRRPLRSQSVPSGNATNGTTTLVAFASQTGFAAQLAGQTAQSLAATSAVRLVPLAELDGEKLAQLDHALFVVSTTGEG